MYTGTDKHTCCMCHTTNINKLAIAYSFALHNCCYFFPLNQKGFVVTFFGFIFTFCYLFLSEIFIIIMKISHIEIHFLLIFNWIKTKTHRHTHVTIMCISVSWTYIATDNIWMIKTSGKWLRHQRQCSFNVRVHTLWFLPTVFCNMRTRTRISTVKMK